MNKEELILNTLLGFICHKTNQTNHHVLFILLGWFVRCKWLFSSMLYLGFVQNII